MCESRFAPSRGTLRPSSKPYVRKSYEQTPTDEVWCGRILLYAGIAYCQLIDSVLPRKVPLHKLNFTARFHEVSTRLCVPRLRPPPEMGTNVHLFRYFYALKFTVDSTQDNVKNLTILETTLRRLNVNKQLDVEALAKGRFK
eukprot:8489812-Pyramimonas_sp.AAC.3